MAAGKSLSGRGASPPCRGRALTSSTEPRRRGRPPDTSWPPIFSMHRNHNARHRYFKRLYYSRARHESYKTYLWAPWIIEYMLKKNGFTNVEVKPYADPYNMAQTYLHTAKSPNH